ncbi:DUF1016 N-terminal domain-containing protein [Clostridium sp. CS001]|nr:DUF1016 N-terminal domain-containing protein [Clostridium sp. CS001]
MGNRKNNYSALQDNERTEYGIGLISELSRKLTIDYGRGFDKSNLSRMRKFYLLINKVDALRQELSWTHYSFIIKLNDERKKSFL